MKRIALATVLMALFISAPAYSQDLASVKASIATVEELGRDGIITASQRQQAIEIYMKRAKSIDANATLETLSQVETQQLTFLQKVAGLITFVNTMWLLAIIIGVISIGYLFGHYVKMLLKILVDVPVVIYEIVFYTSSVSLMVFGKSINPAFGDYFGLTGCLLFAAALGFTYNSHVTGKQYVSYCSLLTAVWAAAALYYSSALIGYFAAGVLMAALGFSVIALPLCYCIGFRDECSNRLKDGMCPNCRPKEPKKWW